ncbi:MAG: hypothetical protein IJ191_07470, partial [Treponema sp.]|nr:hypothetical protein [Treponema sp.]
SPATRVKKLVIKTDPHGYRLVITLDVPYGIQLTETVSTVQRYIIDKVENYTGILIEEVSVIIDKVSAPD